ncbi:MAG: malonate decarboxylase holo-[acyl-carrier-protein] synthase [Rhodospirillales bacterium]
MPPPDDSPCLARHAFVWLAKSWQRQLQTPLPQAYRARIESWRAAGYPFVVARGEPADGEAIVRLGLALPDKTRLGFGVTPTAVIGMRPPPTLDEVMPAALPAWTETLRRVDAIARHHRVTVAVYGSLAWQALTGFAYLRSASDVDLLLTATRWGDLMDTASALAVLDGPPRLDGEALLTDGAAVTWRELAAAPPRLLVKGRSSIRLVRYDDVRAQFMARAA